MKKICFVLPGFSRTPIGGYKMVFEYANRLVKEGYNVSILFLNQGKLSHYNLPAFIEKILAHVFTQIEPRWFVLDKRIQKVSSLDENYKEKIKNLDICFATAVETVSEVKSNLQAKRKFYFIQDYENWHVSDKFVTDTYGIGFKNIVISKWLKNIVDKYSNEPSILIPNAIDTEIYKNNILIEKRKPHTIALLYHTAPHKGLKYAFEVLKEVKALYPDLQVTMFGQFPKPEIPDWITYYRSASQAKTVEIYNTAEVFLCSTLAEGYGLTGIEAMACGSCLVSTEYTGVKEYAVNGYNALLSPVKDVQAQVNNIVRVFEDEQLRKKISSNGIQSVKQFSWDNAMKKFNKAIEV